MVCVWEKNKNIISPTVIGHHNSTLAPTIDLLLCYGSVLGVGLVPVLTKLGVWERWVDGESKNMTIRKMIVTQKALWSRDIQRLNPRLEKPLAQEVGENFLMKGWGIPKWIQIFISWITWLPLGFLESYISCRSPFFFIKGLALGNLPVWSLTPFSLSHM